MARGKRRPGNGDEPKVVLPEAPTFSKRPSGAATLPEPEPLSDELPPADPAMWVIVLAGGIGSRFWPLSTPERPKPVLALLGENPLVTETVSRLAPLVPPERVLILTSRDIAERIRLVIPDVPPGNILVEARPLGTAAALAWGAQEVAKRAGPRAICTVMHSDLAVSFPDMFRATLQRSGALAATHSAIVAVGVKPSRPDTAFGYIVPGLSLGGRSIDEGGAAWAREFVEKPAPLLAGELIAAGALWNAGMLTAEARVFTEALVANTKEVALGLEALEMNDTERFAGMIRSISIERGLLERTDRLLVIPGEFGWDDVGTWGCLSRARELDDLGNGTIGKVHCVDSSSNVVHGESGTVVLYGVSKMLVVTLEGLTFVTPLERANDLKPLLDSLPGSMRMKPSESGAKRPPRR